MFTGNAVHGKDIKTTKIGKQHITDLYYKANDSWYLFAQREEITQDIRKDKNSKADNQISRYI
ncbi:MAG: hypothetical protein SCALA701_01210 [Candidatus Scalindua sp.]|nr:MAG: hypothetical protein SCALA701_01210 [Candidatus Scalindua sp.]